MEEMIYQGGEVKALGNGKLAGYLVRFSNADQADLEGDYFTAASDLGISDERKLPVYYQHGMDTQIGKSKIGTGIGTIDDVGLWFEAQLDLRDKYERMIYSLAEKGKLGWSSGAAGHLVEREPVGKAYHLKSWVIAEASLTPTPAEPRNTVMPIKSILDPFKEKETMPNELETQAEVQPTVDIGNVVERAIAEAMKKYEAAQPKVTAGFVDEVKSMKVDDEADRAVKGNPFTAQEFFKSVHQAAVRPYDIDKRLNTLKATGMNEAIPSQGGFLVPADVSAGIFSNMWNTGSLLSLFNPITVSGNALTINAVDETSRVAGSRGGGILGYWLNEGGTKTATKPKFRQIELKLKKLAALCYATDELLDDATALESWISTNVPNELRFMVEDSIINGDGVGKPLGILASGALVSATRTDATEIDSLDITRMWARRYLGVSDYVWLGNAAIAPQIYNMTLGDQPVYLPPGGFSASPYGSILGRPYIETEYNPALGTLGDIMLVSPSQYAMITKGGIQAASSMHVQFVTDEMAFRFVYRVDGEPYWNTYMTPFKGTDTISPFVALAAST